MAARRLPGSSGTGALDAARQAGGVFAGTALDRYGSKKGIRDNIANPLTSSTAPMRSINGNVSFNGQVSCPSSAKFLQVFIGIGAKGDLSPVIVKQDTNLDGNFDYTYSIPFQVSGVCANGVISCDPGTWINCSYYRWTVDSAFKVSLQSTGVSNLGGCTCVNSDCANPNWNVYAPVVLKSLGGGVVGAIQSTDSSFAVSDTRVDGTLIDFYGNNAGDCGGNPGGTTSASLQTYRRSGASLENAALAKTTAAAKNPASYYNLINNSSANTGLAQTEPACRVKWVWTVSTSTMSKSGNGTGIMCVPYSMDLKIGFTSKSAFVVSGNATTFAAAPGCGSSTWTTLENGTISPDSMVSSITVCGFSDNAECNTVPVCNTVTGSGPALGTMISCGSVKNRPLGYSYSYNIEYKTDNISTYISDTCNRFQTDPKCRLKEENIDGVFTYANFQPTGLAPLSSCRTFTSGIRSYTICKQWWKKDRKYLCTGSNIGMDFSDARTRAAAVEKSATDAGGSLYYSDQKRDGNGNWITVSNSVVLPASGATTGCELACKTKVPVVGRQAGTAGHTGQYSGTATDYEFRYKACVDGTCPLDAPGEVLVADCQCLGEFSQAASAMNLVDLAGRDLICSTGRKF